MLGTVNIYVQSLILVDGVDIKHKLLQIIRLFHVGLSQILYESVV